MSSRAKVIAGVLVGIVVLAGVVAVAATLANRGDDQPTASNAPTGTSLVKDPVQGTATPVIGGGEVTFGWQILRLSDGATPVQLTAVHLVGATGMTLEGVRVADPKRPVYQFISEPRFPPSKNNPKSVPAIGATITQAKRGWGLLIGLRVSAGDYAVMHGVQVEYRIAGQGQIERQTFPTTFVACTAQSQLKNGRCSPPASLRG